MRNTLISLVLLLTAACTDSSVGPVVNSNQPDKTVPRLTVLSPLRGSVQPGEATTIEVSGLVEDHEAGLRVHVNNQPARIEADGSWKVVVPIYDGMTFLHTTAIDLQGNRSEDTRAVLSGPLVNADTPVEDGIVLRLDARAVREAGVGAATRFSAVDLGARLAPRNPIFENPIPCVRSRADLQRLVHGAVRIDLWLLPGAIGVDAEIRDLDMSLGVQYSDSCTTTKTAVGSAHAGSFRFTGKVQLGVDGAGLVATDRQDADYGFDSLELDQSLPGKATRDLEQPFADALAELLADQIAEQVPSALLRGLGENDRSVEIGGRTLQIALRPTELFLDSYGVSVAVDCSISVPGGFDAMYLATGSRRPTLDSSRALSMGVADDVLNQMVSSLWATGQIDAGAAGNAAGLAFDTVELAPRLPPLLTALPNGGGLRLALGDVEAQLRRGGESVGRLSLSAEITLGVSAAGGKITVTALGEHLYVDALRDSFDPHASVLEGATLDAAGQTVADNMVRQVGELLSNVPMPATTGSMQLTAQAWSAAYGVLPADGYLLMTGD